MRCRYVDPISNRSYRRKNSLRQEVEEFLFSNIFTNPNINKKYRYMLMEDGTNGFKHLFPGVTQSYPDIIDTKLASICRRCNSKIRLSEYVKQKGYQNESN